MEVPLGAFAGVVGRRGARSRTCRGGTRPTPTREACDERRRSTTPSSSAPGSVGLPDGHLPGRGGPQGRSCLDQFASPGQGSNKAAIGGIRATHSVAGQDPPLPRLAADLLHLEGDATATTSSGSRAATSSSPTGEQEETVAQGPARGPEGLRPEHRWLDRDELLDARARASTREGLLGGTYSPEDGSASPMLSSAGLLPPRGRARRASSASASGSPAIIRGKGGVVGVRTDKGGYATETRGQRRRRLGAAARAVRRASTRRSCPTATRPASPSRSRAFLTPMLVDIRPDAGRAQLLLLPAQARAGSSSASRPTRRSSAPTAARPRRSCR